MKYSIILLLVLVLIGTVAKSTPDSLFIEANENYFEGNFEKATELYQTLVDSGYQNPDLFYNLANSYFRLNKIPFAILNYERAIRLKPNDEDIAYNLDFAKAFTVDRIEPLPELILYKWYRSTRNIFSANGWAWVSILFFACLLASVLIFWFSFRPWVKRLTFIFGLLFFILGISSVVLSSQQKREANLKNHAIIFQPVVSVKSAPGQTGKDIFILHAGTKVEVTKALGQWVEIRIADGNKGWILSEAIELI